MKRLSVPRTLIASVAVAMMATTRVTRSISGQPGRPAMTRAASTMVKVRPKNVSEPSTERAPSMTR
jgi:hypothetical protein